jgi:predicted nucleic acid-binding protein
MQIVCNASPLIFLAKIDLIHLLPAIAGDLQIPSGVYHEIKYKGDAASDWIEEHANDYITEVDPVPKIIEAWDLGKGETEVIAYAYLNKAYRAALDDKAARNCAASVGVDVIGTIGLILKAYKQGHIKNPVSYLEKLKKTGFRISDDLYRHAVHLADR